MDVPAVQEYAGTLPNVVFTDENLFTCSQDTQEKIKEKIIEHKLNRVVVASCSPKTHEAMFMETLEACGINKYLFEMANIRNQDSWIHSKDPEVATKKAKDLVRMSVARAATLKTLHEKVVPINKQALVIGGGIAGMNAALSLGKQGFDVVLVEKETELGGFSRKLHHTIEGGDIQAYLEKLIEEVIGHKKIEVLNGRKNSRDLKVTRETLQQKCARCEGKKRRDRPRSNHCCHRSQRIPTQRISYTEKTSGW